MDRDKLPGVKSSSLNELLEAAKRVPTLSVTKAELGRMTGGLEYHAATIAATKALTGVNEQKEILKRVTGGLADHSAAIRATQMLKSIGEQKKTIDRYTGEMNLQATIATSRPYLADIASQQEILERFTGIAKTPAYLDVIKGLGAYAMSEDAMERLTGNRSIAKIAEQFMARTSGAERYADAISDLLKATSLGNPSQRHRTRRLTHRAHPGLRHARHLRNHDIPMDSHRSGSLKFRPIAARTTSPAATSVCSKVLIDRFPADLEVSGELRGERWLEDHPGSGRDGPSSAQALCHHPGRIRSGIPGGPISEDAIQVLPIELPGRVLVKSAHPDIPHTLSRHRPPLSVSGRLQEPHRRVSRNEETDVI